ncbi:PQQ-binding-like beta-propeller repeat protein [Pirellulales bacterium]|nr:PQQ-binding-like beta-propeller repeat protein [Pirellulales bacterium]
MRSCLVATVGVMLVNVLANLLVDVPAFGEDVDLAGQWANWRGPTYSGVAPLGDPPLEWSETKNVRWKVRIPGRGSGSPVVVGDRIFLLTAIPLEDGASSDDSAQAPDQADDSSPFRSSLFRSSPFRLVQNDEGPPRGQRRPRGPGGGRGRGFGGGAPPTTPYQFVVLCIDRRNGDIAWQKVATEEVPHERHHGTASFASSSPVTDGENVYVSFGSRDVYSYDIEGNFRWKQELPPLRSRNSFGEGASPALYKDTLVVVCDHEEQSFIIAYDANTGRPKWKQLRDEETSWNTPLIVEHNGVVQVVVNAMNRSRAYDLETGEVLWECGGQASGPVATIVVHDGLAFCTTGHRGSALFAIPLDARGDITGSDTIAWSRNRDTPYVPSPLLYDGLLYLVKGNAGILTCLDAATGDVQFGAKRLDGIDAIYASPVGAAGRVYLAGRNGTTAVVKRAAEFELLAKNRLDEAIDATPAIVGREMFIRGERHLYCISAAE